MGAMRRPMSDASRYGERAQALSKAGRDEEAEAVLREARARWPDNPVIAYALGVLLLASGAYEEGWPLYEYRWAAPNGPPRINPPLPRWRGEDVPSLLILPEQGLGDQIMFARYVPALVARGIAVTLAVRPPLVRLLSGLGAEVIPVAGPVALPKLAAWCLIGSLPLLVGGDIPSAPYLPSRAGGSGVGVMLEGNTQGRLPEPVFSEIAALGRSLHPNATGAGDFEDTAEIIRGLERVVTVDTSVAHLAGAMGKPTTVLLPERSEWRWGRGPRSVWYPAAKLARPPWPLVDL